MTTAGGTFVPLSAARIVNTQTGLGSPATAMTAGQTRAFTVLGVGGVPTANVSAVAVNITAVAPTASHYITAFPTCTTRPATSMMNTTAGDEIAALAQVKVGTGVEFPFGECHPKQLKVHQVAHGEHTTGHSGHEESSDPA